MGKDYSLSGVRVIKIGKGAVTLVTEEELSMRGTAVASNSSVGRSHIPLLPKDTLQI
jgi:hypothetical protein